MINLIKLPYLYCNFFQEPIKSLKMILII